MPLLGQLPQSLLKLAAVVLTRHTAAELTDHARRLLHQGQTPFWRREVMLSRERSQVILDKRFRFIQQPLEERGSLLFYHSVRIATGRQPGNPDLAPCLF